jgi:4-aminobutyrate aminotransferase-like enzyme
MALAQIAEMRRLQLPQRAARMGRAWQASLHEAAAGCRRLEANPRVQGLMGGIELRHKDGSPAGSEAVTVVQRLLQRGFILLPEGCHGEVISLTPPLVIPALELRRATFALQEELARY